jgi:hypothetical protein
MVTVLVDAENVRRSLWPNLTRQELVKRAKAWGSREGHDVVVAFEGAQSADDEIVQLASTHEGTLWVVTSDRELRRRVAPYADRIIGGGRFGRIV